MTLLSFAQEYSQLSSTDQAQFAEAIRRLLADGLIWREDENDRRIYSFLVRRRELVSDYLAIGGWELRYEERLSVFHVIHRDGSHRRRLNREATIWLLLLRLIYAEKRERLEVGLTRYPIVEVSEIVQRYAEFFPGQNVRKRSSLTDALRSFQALKLIRAAGGGGIRTGNVEQLIELLPTLEIIMAGENITALAERLRTYDRTRGAEDRETPDEE